MLMKIEGKNYKFPALHKVHSMDEIRRALENFMKENHVEPEDPLEFTQRLAEALESGNGVTTLPVIPRGPSSLTITFM